MFDTTRFNISCNSFKRVVRKFCDWTCCFLDCYTLVNKKTICQAHLPYWFWSSNIVVEIKNWGIVYFTVFYFSDTLELRCYNHFEKLISVKFTVPPATFTRRQYLFVFAEQTRQRILKLLLSELRESEVTSLQKCCKRQKLQLYCVRTFQFVEVYKSWRSTHHINTSSWNTV
jgi:hypothetical protein